MASDITPFKSFIARLDVLDFFYELREFLPEKENTVIRLTTIPQIHEVLKKAVKVRGRKCSVRKAERYCSITVTDPIFSLIKVQSMVRTRLPSRFYIMLDPLYAVLNRIVERLGNNCAYNSKGFLNYRFDYTTQINFMPMRNGNIASFNPSEFNSRSLKTRFLNILDISREATRISEVCPELYSNALEIVKFVLIQPDINILTKIMGPEASHYLADFDLDYIKHMNQRYPMDITDINMDNINADGSLYSHNKNHILSFVRETFLYYNINPLANHTEAHTRNFKEDALAAEVPVLPQTEEPPVRNDFAQTLINLRTPVPAAPPESAPEPAACDPEKVNALLQIFRRNSAPELTA